MTDLSKYRLPDNDTKEWMVDYIRSMGFREYMDYEEKVYHVLEVLKSGKHYNIEKDVPPDKQELFIKIGCLYIQDHPEVMFSDDYTKIKKMESNYEQWKLETRRKAICNRQCRKDDIGRVGKAGKS